MTPAETILTIMVFVAYFYGYVLGKLAGRRSQDELLRLHRYDFGKDKREFDEWLEQRLEALKRQKP